MNKYTSVIISVRRESIMKSVGQIIFLILLIIFKIVPADNLTFPDCISSRQRANDLISRMTTAEKITQLVHKVSAIARLRLPEMIWWSEALHGIAFPPGVTFGGDLPAATMFPMPIHFGASFNMTLVHTEYQYIS